MGKILVYYNYRDIACPEDIVTWQKSLCSSLQLTGRIRVAKEGINGTIGGTDAATAGYIQAMQAHELFADIDFKESIVPGGAEYFPKLSIKVVNELVCLGLDTQQVRAQDGGKHLTPEEAHELIASQPDDLILLDTRNDYESRVGTFGNALIPNTRTFREFPHYIDTHLDQLKDKQVLMFCTAGSRCERASAYLKSKGVAKAVYQIKGGIHGYVEQFPQGYFKGKNYVFDGRITVPVTDDILASCDHCARPYDEYTNCVNTLCNRQIIVCPSCIASYHNTCSTACLELVQKQKVTVRTKVHKISVSV